jgi:hypothetical protein
MVVPPQPDEPVFPLRREQFDLLCEGEVSEQRTVRDVCLATFGSAMVGLIGLLATVDWDSAVRQGRMRPFIWTAILAAIVLAAAVTAVVAQWRLTRTGTSSGYSRIQHKILDFFDRQTQGK